MAAIHQFLAGIVKGDAISNEAIVLRSIFRSWNYESYIFCEANRIPGELRKEAADVSAYATVCRPEDVVLLHLSVGSPVNDVFARLPCKKAILYHNITPAGYFSSVQKQIGRCLAKGRDQMKALAGTSSVTMADSNFNAAELRDLGYKDVKVLPLLLNFEEFNVPADKHTVKRFHDGLKNILFVGRCAPNKKIEDILRAFFFYQTAVEPSSRLILVGSIAGLERYCSLLHAMIPGLRLRNVHFAGSVPQSQLNAFYRVADIFLCMSEHEGFCIPLIESMLHDVPTMAYAAAAVPETLDGAGILFNKKDFRLVAEMMGELTANTHLRESVISGQRQRLARYRDRDLEGELKAHLQPLLQKTAG